MVSLYLKTERQSPQLNVKRGLNCGRGRMLVKRQQKPPPASQQSRIKSTYKNKTLISNISIAA